MNPQFNNLNLDFSTLNTIRAYQYHISQNKTEYHKQGLLNLFIKGHVTGSEVKQIASELNFPTTNTQVRHLVAYEKFVRSNDAEEWQFSGYSLYPLYKTEVINGRAVAVEAHYVKLNDHEVACSSNPVPVSALFHNGLKSAPDSIEYLNAIIELDMEVLQHHFEQLPAPFELNQYINEHQPNAFERPLYIEVMDAVSGKFVLASFPTTDIDTVLNQIHQFAETGLYSSNRKIAFNTDGEPYISMNYDSQSFNFNQFGDFGEQEYLVQRIRTSIHRGYAPCISQLDSDRGWFKFSNDVLGTGLYIELPAFTELDHA